MRFWKHLQLFLFALCLCAVATPAFSQCTFPCVSVPNSTTGTQTFHLAKVTGAPSKAIITTAGDTAGVIGISTNGGTAGNSYIMTAGTAVACTFDGATTAGDYVSISATVNGDCADAGAVCPATQNIGRIFTTHGTAGTYPVLMSIGVCSTSVGPVTGSGTANTLAMFTAANTIGNASGVNSITLGASSTFSWLTGRTLGRASDGSMTIDGEIRGTSATTVYGCNQSTGTGRCYTSDVSGDTDIRFEIDDNGKHIWGPGNGGVDTNLYRANAGILQTDSIFVLNGNPAVGTTSAASNRVFGAAVSGDTNDRLDVSPDGIRAGPGNAGQDSTLLRVGGSTWEIQNNLGIGINPCSSTNLMVNTAANQNLRVFNVAGDTALTGYNDNCSSFSHLRLYTSDVNGGQILQLDANNRMVSSLALPAGSTLNGNAIINTALTTIGLGAPIQVGVVRGVNQVSGIGTTTIFTVGASNALFDAKFALNCDTTSAAATVNVTLGWTDPASQAQTATLASAVACTALGSSSIGSLSINFAAKAATTITYSTAIVNTPTYDIRGALYQDTIN